MNVSRFRRLLHAVLLSAPCASIGCSDVEATRMPEQAMCPDLASTNRYSALTLSPRVDGIAFVSRGSTSTLGLTRLASLGEPCAKATRRTECLQRVDELLLSDNTPGWPVNTNVICFECGNLVSDVGVITAGDDVRVATLEDVLAAATPVETRDEAAAFLMLQRRALDCASNNVRRDADGWTFKHTSSSCSGESWEIFATVNAATGAVTDAGRRQLSEEDNGCIEGRRPTNLAPTGVAWLSSLPACFSEIAHMEAAAVLAFDELERALAELGAPATLLDRVRTARADEVAHAAMTARLARRFGGDVAAPRVSGPDARPTLLKLALENAVEGCVREAYGALVAAHQAAHAADPRVRAAFSRIARDEAEHAELSFDLDAWLVARLTAEERRAVDDAKRVAWDDLARAVAVEPAADVVAVAGIPTARAAQGLLAQLAHAVDVAA